MGNLSAAAAALREPSTGRVERLDGESLERRLERQGRLPAIDALRIAGQLATALASLHARGLVHRAVTPRNIFLERDPDVAGGERAQLLDLDASVDPISSSPRYMSPEQCRNTSEIDHRADIYALGCLLYHLLIGRPPFVADEHSEILAMQLYETPTPPSVVLPFLGGALDGIVMRCLAKAPGERHEQMTDVVAEIERLLSTNVLAIPIIPAWQLGGAPDAATTAIAPAPASTLGRWRRLVAAIALAATTAALFALARWF